MADGALLAGRGDHSDIAEALQLTAEGLQAGGIDAVVIGKQDSHAVPRLFTFSVRRRLRTLNVNGIDSLLYLLPPQDVVIMLGEAVGFIADVLQQPQSRGMAAQLQRLGVAGPVDLFFALGERDQARRLDAEEPEDF